MYRQLLALLLLSCLVIPASSAAWVGTILMGGSTPSAGCTASGSDQQEGVSGSYSIPGDFAQDYTGVQAQKIDNSSSRTICQVDFLLFANTGPVEYDSHVEVWSAGTDNSGSCRWGAGDIAGGCAGADDPCDCCTGAGTGTCDSEQLGVDSDNTHVTTGSPGEWYTYTWSGTKPNPTGDYFVHIVEDEFAISNQVNLTGSSYGGGDNDYDLWRYNGSAVVNIDDDTNFRIYYE